MGQRGSKGRSITTYKNKLSKLKKIYKNLVKASKKAKKKRKTPKKGVFFCDKYPTEKSYLKTINIKLAKE
jgi:hypothetical protein